MKASLLRHNLWADVVVAVVFLVLWSIAEVGRHQLVPGMRSAFLPWWAALTLLSFSIAVCRRWPLAAMAATVLMLVGQLVFPQAVFGEPAQAIYLGMLLVVLGVASAARPGMRVLSAIFALFAAVSTAGLLAAYGWTGAERIPLFAAAVALFAVAWGLGSLLRVRVAKLRGDRELARLTGELREVTTETIVAGERERIAQDVHDIMAHSLSVILAQADGARSLAEARPEELSRSLATIASSARTSLTEVRMLIEGLVSDPSGAEAPSLADLDPLVERMRDAGLPVTVERYAEPEGLTTTQELAVYRIVQEALTNALKHGGDGAAARVVLDARGGGMMLSVSSSGSGTGPGTGSGVPDATNRGTGRGLHGMRERARLAGGWLEAGTDDDAPEGGYLVTAFIPAAGVVAA